MGYSGRCRRYHDRLDHVLLSSRRPQAKHRKTDKHAHHTRHQSDHGDGFALRYRVVPHPHPIHDGVGQLDVVRDPDVPYGQTVLEQSLSG